MITEDAMSMEEEYGPKIMPPTHPGEILNNQFLIPMNVTQYHLAKATGIDESLIQAVINGQEPISAEIALRFSRFFGTSAELWTGLQVEHDLDVAEDRLGDKLDEIAAYQWE